MRVQSFKGLVRWLIVSSQVVLITKWLVDQNHRNQLGGGEDTVIFDGMMVSFSTVIFPYPGNS